MMRLTLLSLADDSRIEVVLLHMGERAGIDRLDYMIFFIFLKSWLYSQKENTNMRPQTASKLEGEKRDNHQNLWAQQKWKKRKEIKEK